MKAFFLSVCFYSLILYSPGVILCADEISPAPAFVAQDAQDMEFDSIKSRLMTDMFFAGELADEIMEIGVQNRLIPLSGGEDRAQTRAKLILWIRSNPDSAADIYFNIKKKSSFRERGSVKRIWWEINPQFLAMIRNLSQSVQSRDLSREELSVSAQRIFEGLTDGGGSVVNGSVSNEGTRSGPSLGIPPLNWRLDRRGIVNEQKQTTRWLSELISEFRRDQMKTWGHSLPGHISASGLGVPLHQEEERMKSLEQASLHLKDFMVRSSRLAGRKGLHKSESRGLEKSRLALRAALARCHALARIDSIESKSRLIETASASPYNRAWLAGEVRKKYAEHGRLLRSENKTLQRRYLSVFSRLRGSLDNASFSDIYLELSRLREEEFSSSARHALYVELVRLGTEITDLDKVLCGCFLDRIMYGFVSKIYPDSPHVKMRKELERLKKMIPIAIGEIGLADYARALNLVAGRWILDFEIKGAGLESVKKEAERIRSVIKSVRQAVKLNKTIQFVFWDAFLSPLDLTFCVMKILGHAAFGGSPKAN